MLEAQASGLPVVGYDLDPVNERIRQGVDGVLVPLGQTLALALAESCNDVQRRRQMGRAARQSAEQQGWQPIFDVLERRYQALAEARDPLQV
jgi:glycosyltransferase involved in cell wall biosynthesis